MNRTRPFALLVALFVTFLVAGSVTTLAQHAGSVLFAVGVAAAGLVGLACVVGARRAGRTGTAYW